MAKKKVTKKPSGLKVVRSGNKFTFSWTKGDSKYSKQVAIYKINPTKKKKYSYFSQVTKNTTSKNLKINLEDYYPYKYSKTNKKKKQKKGQYKPKLKGIRFAVRGVKNNKYSGWSPITYDVLLPHVPFVSAELSSTYQNQTTFKWGIDWGNSTADASPHMFTEYEWDSILLKNDKRATNKLPNSIWTDKKEAIQIIHGHGTKTSLTITEDRNFSVHDDAYTRHFRVRAVGPQGKSEKFAYAHHVYSFPYEPTDIVAEFLNKSKTNGYAVQVRWTSAEDSYMRPIDSTTVEYAIATPSSSYIDENGTRKAVLSIPEELSWTAAGTINDTKKADGLSFTVGEELTADKRVFVRVNNKHDNNISYSDVMAVTNGSKSAEYLPDPTNLSATVNNNIATITVTNNSAITASFVGIYYRTDTQMGNPRLIGIYPAGNSSPINVQLPDIGDANSFSLGAKAFVADYSPITPLQSGVTDYSLGEIYMESRNVVWDERPVPKPPKISLTSPRQGVIRVSWDWKWTDANGVELSWSENNDAWESTAEPSTYTIENTRASAWNIAGLDVGEWFVRVRMFKIEGEAKTFGTYSSIESIKLASTPSTPVLTISPEAIPVGSDFSCYWSYTAIDGDEQLQAEIKEATIDQSGAITYGALIAKVDSEQYKTIKMPDTWRAGDKKYLAVKIITSSGEDSNNWSAIQPISILEPITAHISDTSLVNKTIVEDDGDTRQQLSLTDLPLVVSSTGADSGGIVRYIIERADQFYIDRPDENDTYGFKGETVAIVEVPASRSYALTTDTNINPSKQYYTRSGTGTEDDPYEYIEVLDPVVADIRSYYEITSFNFDYEIDVDDLLQPLNDNAKYYLIATHEDSNGQSDEDSIHFEVHWDHQATMPIASVVPSVEDQVTFITPIQPDRYYKTKDVEITPDVSYSTFSLVNNPSQASLSTYYEKSSTEDVYFKTEDTIIETKNYYKRTQVVNPVVGQLGTYYVLGYEGDNVDIYRLSIDKPELIVQNGTFGTTYVDQYPTLGDMGGHRIVYKTDNNDYIDEYNQLAWVDYDEEDGNILDLFATIIDFGDDKVILPWDLSLSYSWSKDFTETRYLGGAIQGDWNSAVSRTGSVKTRVAVQEDSAVLEQMRRLAMHAGICHIRTPDGSSFAANIDVSEDREERKINMIASFSLNITRVDPEGFDGITLDDWEAQ